MKLVFYNHYGIGDLFESREFVRDWMRLCGVTRADYAHREFPGLFEDLPQLRSIAIQPEMDMRAALTWNIWGASGLQKLAANEIPSRDFMSMPRTELWVNTWIGARNAETQPPGDYVLWPGVGCTVENLYRMHNDYLREAGLPPLPRSVAEYLPVIDYRQVTHVAHFARFAQVQAGKRLVLVCNGATGSGHAANFDFGEVIKALPARADRILILTDRVSSAAEAHIRDCRPDVYYTDDFTRRRQGWCDVNAISYLSRFCDVIVGRCSGAQMPCQTRENWLDSTKTLVCFTEHRNGACFVRDPVALGLRMKVAWSPAANAPAAAKFLKEVLN